MDFTPQLGKIRKRHEISRRLLANARLVLCQGSRTALVLTVQSLGEPVRIVGAATTEAEGLELVRHRGADLLLASDRLEQGCGLSLAVAVKRVSPATRILLLVGGPLPRRRLRAALEAGCEGILLERRLGLGHELTALRTILGGDRYLDQGIGTVGPPVERPHQPLSRREGEVLQGVAEGRYNHEIAAAIYVSVDTVKTHLRNVLTKLGARDRAHAVAIGLALGLIESPDLRLPG